MQIIAKQHKKTPSQIVLRGLVQSNIAVIPRSTKPSHMKSNLEIFDFELSNEEMALLYSLRYFVTSPLFAAPSHAGFFFSFFSFFFSFLFVHFSLQIILFFD